MIKRKTPKFYLSGLKTRQDLKELLAERWNYNLVPSLPLSINFKQQTEGKILEGEILAEFRGFKIVFCRLDEERKSKNQTTDQFLRSTEREIITQFPASQKETKLFVFSSKNGDWWHFVNADQVGSRLKIKRFIIEPENRNRLRTASEQLDKIKINPVEDDSLQKIKVKHEEAFSLEALTDKFFKEYVEVFKELKKFLFEQKKDIDDALKTTHHYTHQLLNRIMFLYFVQKRGCFDGNKNFLHDFWNAYRDNFEGKNEFHKKWLEVLFFEALNQPSFKFEDKKYLDLSDTYPNFNPILKDAPYLNGGLFSRREFDAVGYEVLDRFFTDIFNFFESYNFTIQESTPLDQDLSINPEMLGNIYEMLVNVSEAEDVRHKAGIFYTPKEEIELMIRRSLVEFLLKKTNIGKEKLYEFVFRELKEEKVPEFTKSERDNLLKELDDLKMIDPACGSGHYLVVATKILYELKKILYKQKGISLDKFAEKKKIVENSIFGVDVKEWAAAIAELRLWLSLFIDADKEKFESFEPLLPSLSFKIRVGDSLVQEIGERIVGLRDFKPGRSLWRELENLKKEKHLLYQNRSSDKKVENLERNFLYKYLQLKERELFKKIQNINVQLNDLELKMQGSLLPEKEPKKNQEKLFKKEKEELKREKQKIEKKMEQIKSFVQEIQELAREGNPPPFIWDVAFAEIFDEKKGKDGFDIVIANPPYVRQELIADPTKGKSTVEEKRKYKEKLEKQLQADWNDPKGALINIPKRSDLYVYFYLKGLKLLNSDGIFCYISSNSWLDVGYGAKLQEILCRRVPILAIYDNQAKRSFKRSDVNTVIVILGSPKKKDWEGDLRKNIVKFAIFKKPFEEVMFTENFIEIEDIEKRKEAQLFKVFPIKQGDLYEAGMEYGAEKGEKKLGGGKYIGNKWGGKYLKAPEIYWKILEKGQNKLVRLGDIAEVRFGIKTGANEFFYVEDVTNKISK